MEEQKKFDKKECGLVVLCGSIAIAVVVCAFLFWSRLKVMWFCDEIYSFFTANSEYGLGGRIEYGKWYDSQFIVDDLTADTRTGRFTRTLENVRNDEHPPIFFLMMRVMSLIMKGSISKWVGLSINLICMIGLCLLSYVLFYLLTRKKILAMLSSIALCLLPSVMTNAMLIRMYCMLSAWGMLYVLLAYLIFKDYFGKWKWTLYVAICLTTTCGFLTQYYFAVFAVGFTLAMMVYLFLHKRYKHMIAYMVSMASSVVIATVAWRHWIRQMFLGYCGQDVVKSAFDPTRLLSDIWYSVTIMPKITFFKWYVVGMILMVIGIGYLVEKKNKEVPFIAILLCGSHFYSLVVAHVTPIYYMDTRYFYLSTAICYIAVIMVLLQCITYLPKVKNHYRVQVAAMVLLIAFNMYNAWFDEMGMGYVDRSGEYFEKLDKMYEYKDIPWMYYGYECWSMMELYYDMAGCTNFIVYHDGALDGGISDFDDHVCPTNGQDFLIMINANSYEDPYQILKKLDTSEGCHHEYEFICKKSSNIFVVRHK